MAITLLVGCGREPTLLGHWRHVGQDGQTDELIFHRDGTVIWRSTEEDLPSTMGLRYEMDLSVVPHRLDIDGFERGPLEGQTLFGIFEFEGRYALVWDAQPGPADANGAELRPTELRADARRFERVR
ncbi:MAG: hypothetical protein JRE43_08980 [Deltaproteobacteria bacterium]|nr:hypothetical protein [Deltaproteobacteria bacterium]